MTTASATASNWNAPPASLAAPEVAAHETLSLDLSTLGGNPLTDPTLAVPTAESKRQRDTVVPFRNMLFATLAAAYCATKGIVDLYMAPVKDDYAAYRDCRRPFYDILAQSLRLGAAHDAALGDPHALCRVVETGRRGSRAPTRRPLRGNPYLL